MGQNILLNCSQEFGGLQLAVTPAVLIPRQSTEALVGEAVQLGGLLASPPQILDLGTGSGNILLACLHALPGSRGVGMDISEAALEVVRQNAAST